MTTPLLQKYILKYQKQILMLASTFIMSACSFSTSSQVKEASLEIAKNNYQKTIDLEIAATITDSHPRAQDFKGYILKKQDFNIEEVSEISSTEYLVKIKTTVISPEARRTLLDIMNKQDPMTIKGFNFANALGLIHQQKPQMEMQKEEILTISVRKTGDSWGP